MWSKELQKQTKEFLIKYEMAPMKNSNTDVGCGICTAEEGKYYISERGGDGKYEYDSIEALIEDGWAID